jgi:Tfp pilus assembly protein PilE
MSTRSLHIKYIIVVVILAAITVMSMMAMFNRTDRMFAAESALADVQGQLTESQIDAASTKASLTTTTTKLATAEDKLTETQTELSLAENTLEATTASLNETAEKLAKTEDEYTVASEQLSIETNRADSLADDLGNLQVNYDRMTTGYGYVLKDPTYQQMKSFIAADRTDANEYIDDSYVCGDFSADVKKNANEQNIRCAYVVIDHPGTGHVIVAFNTTDRGMIYIEPQSDEEVNLRVGKEYWQCVVPRPGYYYVAPDYDDTILKYTNVW